MPDQQLASQIALLNLITPADGAAVVTPHDTDLLPINARSLYVGGAGNLVVTMVNGDEVTFTGVPAGTVLSVRVKRVKNTNTTATNIVAMY